MKQPGHCVLSVWQEDEPLLFVQDTRSGSVTLLLAGQLQVRDKCCVGTGGDWWGLVGTNKPKMLFVLKICYLIQNMWWPGNTDIKLLQQHSVLSSPLLWCLTHSQRIRVQSPLQPAGFTLPTAWLIGDTGGGRRYFSISGNHWKKHAQLWSK